MIVADRLHITHPYGKIEMKIVTLMTNMYSVLYLMRFIIFVYFLGAQTWLFLCV